MWTEKAANAGDVGGITNIGSTYCDGVGVHVSMQTGALPVHIENKPARPPGTFALTGTTSALLYP
jgi:hypothetical protein